MVVSELIRNPGSNGLLKSFQDSFLSQKIDKRRHEAYSYFGARMSESEWLYDIPSPSSLSMVRLSAQLAWEGHLPFVKEMGLEDINLSDIHHDHFCKLTSKVTDRVHIANITPASLDFILESNRCSVLGLANMTLTEPNTQALVTALTERLETVSLFQGLTVDIETLCQYNGRGKCRELVVWHDTRERYEKKFIRWTVEVGWAVTSNGEICLSMQRK